MAPAPGSGAPPQCSPPCARDASHPHGHHPPAAHTLGAVIMSVVIGTGCYFLVSYFRSINAKHFRDAVEKKKLAGG